MSSYDESQQIKLSQAVNDFYAAHRKANLESILSPLRGKTADLLSYDMVRQKFRLIESARRELKEIPLDKIVGSVNRYTDFTRSFLPRQESDAQRWAYVRMGVESIQGLPPIEAYQLGDIYFVSDGHHRVSVARELGSKSIEAYVTPVFSRVPIFTGDSPDDIILKSEYDEFLSKTHLDDLRPGANLLVTAPGQYQKLLEHISVHRFFMGEKRGKEIPYPEAVGHWYDTVYLPIATLIQERNLLRDFPGRTEADLYLWIMDYRQELSGGGLGWEVQPERAAADLAARFSPTAIRRLPRLANKFLNLVIPPSMESGPAPGVWRAERQSPHRGDRLFDDILVTVMGGAKGGAAVRMAVEIAQREEARLTGLHILADEDKKDEKRVQKLKEEFTLRCAAAGIAGRLIVETGSAAGQLCQHSPWVDLIVFRLNYPPPTHTVQRLNSGSRLMIRRCRSPLVAVPDSDFHLNSALLAYGPGRKSDEALFLATYLAGRWQIPLTVVTVRNQAVSPVQNPSALPSDKQAAPAPTAIERARFYLELHNIQATYIEETGDPAQAILFHAEAQSADFIIMGGYESGALRESLFGSSVDRVLRSTRRPTLICR